ncbi:histidine--tRNA ligase, partial [Candidatus Aerophobetes bacterium]|nr:histidine--tRNA ligase [Candidatus Aerophobetes bacterium]
MINAPRGVEDILPPRAFFYFYLEKKAFELFSLYGYKQIRIPTFEKTELFLISVGEETDVGKQMYTFKDRAGRSLSLRPEGTAGIVRCFIEKKLYGKEKQWRVCYAGQMFRYEKPQAGRLREFYQIGAECFGEKNPWVDVELIKMASTFLNGLGLDGLEIQINSIGCRDCRGKYILKLKDYLKEHLEKLCSVCTRRFETNPLRILDCKNKNCKNLLKEAPQIKDSLCQMCREHFDSVKKGLEKMGVFYRENPYLVRGLDYYTRTIFEIISPYLGAQDAVCAGGRYDDLIEQLGGPPTPATGFAIGVERLLLSLEKAGINLPQPPSPPVFLAFSDSGAIDEGLKLAEEIRKMNIG